MLNDQDETEIERRLENWARWHASGGGDGAGARSGGSGMVSSIYSQRPRGQRSGYRVASVPVLSLDAQETDRAVRAVQALAPEVADALVAWYRRRGPSPGLQRFDAAWTQEDIAAALGCSSATLRRRLVAGRELVHEALGVRAE